MATTLSDQQLQRQLGDPRANLRHPLARPVVWAVLVCLLSFIGWSAWAHIAVVTHGEGRVIPVSRIQSIQSLEGGIIDELEVREGDIVDKGQLLVKLSGTRFRSAYQETENQVQALKAAIARLQAEVLEADSIDFPADVDAQSSLARSERELFHARREKLREATGSLDHEIQMASRRLNLIQPLVERKAVSQMESLQLQQDIASLRGKRAEIQNSYVQDAYTELTDKKGELSSLEQVLVQRQDQYQRTELNSPVHGRVNAINYTTRGGVVPPGETIMEVIPLEDQLLLEAKIKPQDVAFLAPGMPASVKITAYDYTIYGDLEGTVEQISADTIEEETPRGTESYYKVYIRTESGSLTHNGKDLPIIPGMIAQVDIQTGERSVLDYLLKPLLKANLY
ncbi:HlyD family type I secretion periplasmic adaptor subunit [Chromohalobacter israelensis]|uniref:Membrane fusion protein (MFP) family protein n=1 Tax=Chromohalobacter israelensis (strain ATCC BAA-138 / DSM 3043 / CIP 106854 / NCIMB 13768 / 1H11) TaxID=290398 RepID=Q1R1J2_CHRI1|nr:HlyD family type I secretion periplasmic adaptor subunit [Chromohalobacter salexigens]ABE57416.1 Type I secretion membrane fusion protein, HlyD [Chromohalobacter salexigens DSM 3043]